MLSDVIIDVIRMRRFFLDFFVYKEFCVYESGTLSLTSDDCSVIAPLVSSVAGLSASSSSNAHTITETINTSFPAGNFLKYVVTKVVFFNCCF